jgi:hypothetical protein
VLSLIRDGPHGGTRPRARTVSTTDKQRSFEMLTQYLVVIAIIAVLVGM